MSYDLAVWEGERPATDDAAADAFARMMERMVSGEPPSDRIRAYVEELLQQWPEDDDQMDDAPWAAGPLIDEAFGDAIYFSVVPSRADEVAEFAAQLAGQHGLVCYDPQQGSLRTDGTQPDASQPDAPQPDAPQPDEGAPPRSVRDWLSWLGRTIFG